MAQTTGLNRTLGLRLVIVLVIGNVIGSGVYKKVAPMAAELHSPGWVIICWILGGVITLFGALSNAEVAGMLADTGGEYSYYKVIYNKFFAFIFGWSLFTVIQTGAISSLSYVFVESLNSIVPLPEVLPSMSKVNIGGVFYPFANLNVKLGAIALIILLTAINARGVKAGAYVSTIILLLVFTGIGLIIIFGLSSSRSHVSQVFTLATSNGSTVTASSVFTAMLSAFWAYQGWSSIGYVGGEVRNPHKNIPRGITIGVLIVISIYLLVNTTYLSLLSVDTLEQIRVAGTSIAAVEAVRTFWGGYGAVFISGLIMLTTLGCTNATILSSSRTYFAMAGEGLFFRKAALLNGAKAPYKSLWYQGIWACVLILSGSFDQLTDMIVFAVFLYFGATALGLLILRKRMPDRHRPYRVWGYPFVPAIFVLFCAAIFLNTIFTRPREAAIGLVLMLIGVPMYYYFTKNNVRQKIAEAKPE